MQSTTPAKATPSISRGNIHYTTVPYVKREFSKFPFEIEEVALAGVVDCPMNRNCHTNAILGVDKMIVDYTRY